MIAVTRLANQLLSFWKLTDPSYFWTDGSRTIYWSTGAILLAARPDGNAPVVATENIPFGYIHQGRQVMGDLRDKDVFHLNAVGHVTVSGRVASGLPRTQPTYGLYDGVETSFGATKVNVKDILPLAEGSYKYEYHYYPDEFSDSYYRYLEPRGKHITIRINIADKFISVEREFRTDAYSYEYKSSGIWKRTFVASQKSSSLIFYQLMVTAGVVSMKQSTLYNSANPGEFYTLPKGQVATATIVADPAKYGITVPLTTSTTKYTSTSSTLEEGSEAVFTRVCQSIRDSGLQSYVTKMFAASPHYADFGTLTSDLCSQQDYVDANLLLTGFDLLRLKADLQSWQSLSDLFRKLVDGTSQIPGAITSTMSNALFVKSLFRTAKKWSQLFGSAYLGIDYGVLPTVRDTRALFEGLHSLANFAFTPSRKHARRSSSEEGLLDTPITSVDILTAEMSSRLPTDFLGTLFREQMEYIEGLRRWGMYPNFEMLWDFIPFSFAIDWFVDIGSAAEDADTIVRSQYFPIDYCIMSTKRSWSPPVTRIWPYMGVSGSVVFSHYTRYLDRTLPLPTIKVEEGSGLDSHWAEATALVVTRRGKR